MSTSKTGAVDTSNMNSIIEVYVKWTLMSKPEQAQWFKN